MSDHGSTGAAAPGSAGRTGAAAGMDERSQRLLQGGAASRAWADTAARETVRSDGASPPPTSTYQVASAGPGIAAPTATAAAPAATRSGSPRRARLRVSHVSPLSVLRLSLLLGACLLVVLLVAVAALWFVLDSAGVFTSITDATSSITDSGQGPSVWFSFGRVMLITVVLGILNVLIVTLLSTVAALLYNLCSDFVGGVEVTLSER